MSLDVSFRGSQERGFTNTPEWMANTPETGGSITMNAVTTIAHAIAFITTQQLLAQHFWIPDRTDRVPCSLARSLATNSCSGQYKLCWPFVRIPCTISSILTTKFIARQFKMRSQLWDVWRNYETPILRSLSVLPRELHTTGWPPQIAGVIVHCQSHNGEVDDDDSLESQT